jgi:superfamily II DNA or RNA helicase
MAMPDRRCVLAGFKDGRFRVLVGCEVLTEGYDERSIGCVLMARPTKSRGLYQQIMGRGLRLCPEINKADLLVLDIVDNCRRHELMTATSLLGAETTDADGNDVLEVAERGRQQKEEEFTPQASPVQVCWDAVEVDPFGQTWKLDLLEDYQPVFAWQRERATAKQIEALVRRGWSPAHNVTKGEAAHLLDLATPKQRRALVRRGLWQDEMTFDDAHQALNQIALAERW